MGKLIVLEGTDGSGKSTQFAQLASRLDADGIRYKRLVFPQYSEPSSALLRMYLNGDFGANPEDVNAYAASTFYAVDRYASYSKVWREDYCRGGLILADRYTTSNAVHQASKLPKDKWAEFFDWLYDFEFRLLELPKPDLVILLNMPTDQAEALIRARCDQTGAASDIHEADSRYLEKCRASAMAAAAYYGWRVIECVSGGRLKSVDQVHEEIFSLVSDYIKGVK